MWLSLLVTGALVPEMVANTRRPAEVIDLADAAARRRDGVLTAGGTGGSAAGESAAQVVRLATS